MALIAVIPAALTVFFAFNDGGYFPGAIGIVTVELSLLIVLRIALARIPWEGFGIPLIVATVALGFLAAWTLASQGWSHAPIRAITEYDRALLYLLTLIFFGSIGFSVQRMRWMVYALAVGIVAVGLRSLSLHGRSPTSSATTKGSHPSGFVTRSRTGTRSASSPRSGSSSARTSPAARVMRGSSGFSGPRPSRCLRRSCSTPSRAERPGFSQERWSSTWSSVVRAAS